MAKVKAPDVCRLTLTIRGEDYILRRVSGRTWDLWRDGVAAATVYRVAPSSCTCPDSTIRHRGVGAIGCKHQRSLRAVGLLD